MQKPAPCGSISRRSCATSGRGLTRQGERSLKFR